MKLISKIRVYDKIPKMKIVYHLIHPGCASLTQPLSTSREGKSPACGAWGELEISTNYFS